MRILLVDSRALVRTALRSLLVRRDHEVVGEAADGRDAILAARWVQPEVVLVALPLLEAVGAARAITAESPGVKVILLTDRQERAARLASAAGAYAIVPGNAPSEVLYEVLDRARSGEAARWAAGVARAPRNRARGDELTAREREVLGLMAAGVVSNRTLAERLGISENTIKFHIRNILMKLRLRKRADAVIYAVRHGLSRDER